MSGVRAVEHHLRTSIASLSVVPLLILTLAVIGTMLGAGWYAATGERDANLRDERMRLLRILESERNRFAASVERAVQPAVIVDDLRLSELPIRLVKLHEIDTAAVVNATDGVVAMEPSFAQTSVGIARSINSIASNLALRGDRGEVLSATRDSAFISIDQRPAIVTLIPMRSSREPVVVIALKLLAPETIRAMGETTGIDGLTLAENGPTEDVASATVPDIRGGPGITFSWNGRVSLAAAVKPTIIGVSGVIILLAYGAFVYFRVRGRAMDLATRAAEAQHKAGHDPLSGLPNRSLFTERLARSLARRSSTNHGVAVMLLDLDKFKDVNDTLGHAAGDLVIIEFGRRVHGLLRGVDTLARLGGDEFAVIQVGITNYREVEALARNILAAAREPMEYKGAAINIGVSIGIALAPENGVQASTLLRAADTALYRAKSEGRNRYSFYEDRLDEAEKMRKLVEDELRGVIERDELQLHYQPQVAADDGRVVAVEALVRWHHARLGSIPPSVFVAAAEERGLVVQLGEWVLRRACRDAARWPHLKIAVNVSPIQFKHRDFVASVERALTETGLDPARLELEVTEGVLIEDADVAERALMELRALGIRLALDDFGTGYSSLIYLRRFAFDKIKMDKSFLDSMEATGESAILVHSVVHLGRALGLEVTAEGVETEEQQRFLQAVGCHFMQGYLFSRPVPADEIDRLLKAPPTIESAEGAPVSAEAAA